MTDALNAAISGLSVSQQALSVISANISNASTVGYTRKTLPQSTLIVGGTGIGVQSAAVTRNVNTSLQLAQTKQGSTSGYYSVVSNYLSQIMDYYGASESENSISSKLSSLKSSLTELSANPSSASEIQNVIGAAQDVADEFNNYDSMITSLRSQTESDITTDVDKVNTALTDIAKLNSQITELAGEGRSTADLQDQRDLDLKTVSQYLDVNYYQNGDSLVVITKKGTTLVDSTAHTLSFASSNITPTKYYPSGGLNGLIVDGQDITSEISSGEIGGLFELRDETLPKYQAQMDELAQKTASRFQAEGLTLFTDGLGKIPADGTNYTGFSSAIQVNTNIIANPTLIRNGTTGGTEEEGSSEVITRAVEYVFGNYAYQQASGTADISSGTIVSTLGLSTTNKITGDQKISSMSSFAKLTNYSDLPADLDITCGSTTQTITVTTADTAATLATKINTAFGSTIASVTSGGYLSLSYNGTVTLASNATGPSTNAMDTATLAELGFSYGTTTAPNSTFTVQLGDKTAVSVQVTSADTSTTLLAKLNAINGVTASLDASGHLVVKPTDGGSITLTDTVGTALASMGVTISNVNHSSFTQTGLGSSGTLETGLGSTGNILNFSSSVISNQSEAANVASDNSSQESSYLKTIETEYSDTSGVNLDQEMSDLIKMQSVYSASARMISKLNDLFTELLDSLTN